MKYEIAHVDVLSLGKMVAVVYAAASLVMWLFVPIFLLMPTGGDGDAMFAKGFMVFFMLVTPIFNAIMGFIMGLIAGAVYNLTSRSFGGIRLTLKQEI